MRFSAWPFWLQITVGMLNFGLASLALLWWPKRDQHWRVLKAIAMYLILFCLLFVRW
jgi:hypothetical protein